MTEKAYGQAGGYESPESYAKPNGNSAPVKADDYPLKKFLEANYTPENFRGAYEEAQGHREQLNAFLTGAMRKYTHDNYPQMVEGLGERGLVSLLSVLPLNKTGNKEHDLIIDSIGRQRRIEEVSKDPEKARAYLTEREAGKPEWHKYIVEESLGSKEFVTRMLRKYLVEELEIYQRLIQDSEVKIDTGKLKGVVKGILKKNGDNGGALDALSDVAYQTLTSPKEEEMKRINGFEVPASEAEKYKEILRNGRATDPRLLEDGYADGHPRGYSPFGQESLAA